MAVQEALGFRKAMASLGYAATGPSTMHEDNQAAIAVRSNFNAMSSRTKHISTK